MICPLCQHEFDEQTACQGCGFVKDCKLIRCPNCQYEFVEESKTVNFVKRIGEWLKTKLKREVKK